MRPTLPALVAAALAAAAPAQADAEWCFPYQGPVLPGGSIVPRHARLAFHTDYRHEADKLTATIDGAPVQITRSTMIAAPFYLVTAVIESDRTGELVVTFGANAPLHYTVTSAAMPAEVPATIGRATGHLGSDEEEFSGLAIRLPVGTPALFAEVKHKHAPEEPWQSSSSRSTRRPPIHARRSGSASSGAASATRASRCSSAASRSR